MYSFQQLFMKFSGLAAPRSSSDVSLVSPRSSRPAEREAHRVSPGDGASLLGAAAEDQPPRLPAAVRQAAPENDRPAADRHQPRPLHPAAEEEGGGHVSAPAAAGDHEGLVLNMDKERKEGPQEINRNVRLP